MEYRTIDPCKLQEQENLRVSKVIQGMRAMSEEEMAERQRRMAPLMVNAPYKGGSGLMNSWVFKSPSHDVETVDQPPIERPAWWRRLLGGFHRRWW